MHDFALDNEKFFWFFFTLSNSSSSTQLWRLIEGTRHAGENLNYSFKHQLSASTFITIMYELSKGEIAVS